SNFFSTNRAAELQRRNRSDSELKQQHEILLSTLFLEQQLHSTATDEHKRHVNEKIEVLESAEYEWKSETKSGQQQTDDLFSSTITSILPLFSCLDKIRYW
ncbi:unnamed protein product, partial [Rotaria magnacalcarata]